MVLRVVVWIGQALMGITSLLEVGRYLKGWNLPMVEIVGVRVGDVGL
jgi:ABC-type uncharacterized transport system permease subunit